MIKIIYSVYRKLVSYIHLLCNIAFGTELTKNEIN